MAATNFSPEQLFSQYTPAQPGGVLSALFPQPIVGRTDRARPFAFNPEGLRSAPAIAVDATTKLGARETGEFLHHLFTGELRTSTACPLPNLPSVGEFAFLYNVKEPEFQLPQKLRSRTAKLAPLFGVSAANAVLAALPVDQSIFADYDRLADVACEVAAPWTCSGLVERYQINNHEMSATLLTQGVKQVASCFGRHFQFWDQDKNRIRDAETSTGASEFSSAWATVGFQLQVHEIEPGMYYETTGGLTNTGETLGTSSFGGAMHQPSGALHSHTPDLVESIKAFQWTPVELACLDNDVTDYVRDNLGLAFPFIQVGRINKSAPLYRPYVDSATFSNKELLQANLTGRSYIEVAIH